MTKEEWITSLLFNVYEYETDEAGKKYSYDSLARAINEYTAEWQDDAQFEEAYVNKSHISSYFKGRIIDGVVQEKSVPKGIRCTAIERFIYECTRVGSAYKGAAKPEYYSVPTYAMALSSHLAAGTGQFRIEQHQLLGSYVCIQEGRRIDLELQPTPEGSVLFANMSVSSVSKLQARARILRYKGSGIISPDSFVYVFLKNIEDLSNYFGFVFEMDVDAYADSAKPVRQLLAFGMSRLQNGLTEANTSHSSETKAIGKLAFVFNRLPN